MNKYMNKYMNKSIKRLQYTLLFSLLLIVTCFLSPLCVKAADSETKIYGIGSVSKMFASSAIMKLVDEGEIELDRPVTEYLPEFEMADERYRQITVRMLLNHSSGIMGTTFQNCFLFGESDVDYHQILLESLKTQELKADPGEYSVYCNDGFTLAELIVERISGLSFAEYIENEFTAPLSMQNTFMPDSITDQDPIAPIYYQNKELPHQNIKSLASGGIYSTSEDLCQFARIFTNDGKKLLSEESTSAMAAREYATNKICVQEGDSNFNYGLGWDSVDVYPFSHFDIQALSKGGDTGNYGAGLLVLPKQNLSVAVTASAGDSTQCLVLAEQIAMEVLKEEGLITDEQEAEVITMPAITMPAITMPVGTMPASTMPAGTNENAVPIPESLYPYEGIYASNGIWQLTFTDKNTAQIISLENDSDMVQEYIYTDDGTFVSTDGKYISYTGLAQTASGIGGFTRFRFSEESNGKTYMLGTTYSLSGGSATSAMTMPFAEKIGEESTAAPIGREWMERNGNYYYLVSESYNSSYYLSMPCTKIEVLSRVTGYTAASDLQKNCRIVDEDHAVCELDLPVMTGRDLSGYHFKREQGKEFLISGGFTFIREDAIPEFDHAGSSVTLDARSKWYHIGSDSAGKEISIIVPSGAGVYVYDKNNSCIAGSLFSDRTKTLLLPKDGKILFAGAKDSTFTITN